VLFLLRDDQKSEYSHEVFNINKLEEEESSLGNESEVGNWSVGEECAHLKCYLGQITQEKHVIHMRAYILKNVLIIFQVGKISLTMQ
jgi:hypothetical protein